MPTWCGPPKDGFLQLIPNGKRLYAYTGGIVRHCGGTLFIMGGVSDQVHLYLECPNDLSMATLVNKIKANSSRWIHENFADRQDCQWQRGYGVFSVDSRNDEN
jgi:putative transposase